MNNIYTIEYELLLKTNKQTNIQYESLKNFNQLLQMMLKMLVSNANLLKILMDCYNMC